MNGRWMTTRNRHLAAKIEQLIADKIPAGPWITLLLLIATGCVTPSIAPGKILPDGRLRRIGRGRGGRGIHAHVERVRLASGRSQAARGGVPSPE